MHFRWNLKLKRGGVVAALMPRLWKLLRTTQGAASSSRAGFVTSGVAGDHAPMKVAIFASTVAEHTGRLLTSSFFVGFVTDL